MRRRIRYVARAAIAALAITTGMVVLPGPARAADWDQTIQGVVRPDRLFTHPDGKVTVAACGAPSGDSLQAKTFDTTGSTSYVNEVANGNSPKLYACVGQSAIGKDGTLYASGYYSGQSYERLVAYKDNQQKWNVQLPNSCSTFHSIAMGVNGNVYVVGGSCSGSTYRLIGFTPEVASGQTVPGVVLNVAVSNNFYGNTGDFLAAHDDGLVVQLNNGLQFFDYAGNTAGAVQPTDFAKGHDGAIVTNTNGRTFYPVTATTNQQTLCSSSGGYIHARVDGQSPGGVDWTYAFTECEHVWFVRPTYDGGAVIDTWRHDEVSTPLGRWLTAVDGYGDVKWSIQVAQYNGTWSMSTHSITTTLNGDVLLASVLNERTNNPVNDNRVALNLYSGATGQNIGHKLFEGTTHGYSFAGPDDLAALANGRAYTALAECNYTSCGSNRKLYAVDMAAMTPSYPRGAVLANDEPWLDYVALGDSFSSAEGVGPYQTGTDIDGTNECHRSANAYPRLLNGNTSARLRLDVTVACSGATSATALDGWPSPGKNVNEGKQVDELNGSTDVITLTMGGNDIDFVDFVLTCLYKDCGDPINNEPFFDAVAFNLSGSAPSSGDANGSGLLGLYHTIRSKAPNAKIYIAGYPQLLPTTACPTTDTTMALFDGIVTNAHNEGLSPGTWAATLHAIGFFGKISSVDIEILRAAGTFEFNASETGAGRLLVSTLNEKIRDLIEEVDDPSFVYVDPEATGSAFIGHELCTADPSFIGLDVLNKEHSFHPNAQGQRAYQQLFATALAANI